MQECNGGRSNPCSGHGLCLADGTCECFTDTTLGFWAGDICDSCHPEYESARCTEQCPMVVSGTSRLICNNNGKCYDGHCFDCGEDDPTQTKWCGKKCELKGEQLCNGGCPAGRFGAGCVGSCPGMLPDGSNICSNAGNCDSGEKGSGLCRCRRGYAGTGCQFKCPGLNKRGTSVCSGQGQCDAMTGVCTCNKGFVKVDCSQQCPGEASNPCSGHGEC